MIRKLALAGLALVAITAVSAAAASSASAAGKFECDVEPCVVTATSEVGTKAKFTASGISVECTSHLAGTAPEAVSAELTMDAEYTTGTCTQEAHVRMNHCDYLFTSDTASGHAPVHINCAEGSVIELETTTPKCLLTFGTQTPNGGVKYTNMENTITAESTIKDIEFTRHNPTGGFLCGLIPKEGTGTYNSKDTITCWEDEDSPVSGTEATTTEVVDHYNEGAQVDCEHNKDAV